MWSNLPLAPVDQGKLPQEDPVPSSSVTSLAPCFFASNDFGQNYPSLVTHTTVAIAYVTYTRHIARRVPRPCPWATSIFKHRHMLQNHDTRHTRIKHKARTKALASSMPMHNWCQKIKYKIENS